MSQADPAHYAARFAALGDPTRLQLLACLAGGKAQPITQLTRRTSMTRQAVTRHLRVLERAELVRAEKIGRENRFALNPDGLGQAQTYLSDITAQWDNTLSRLARYVEDAS